LISDVELIVTARQPINTKTQALETKDGQVVEAGAVLVYHINDVVQAIGGKNWSTDDTANDITQAVLVEVISSWRHRELLENINGKVKTELTEKCRKELRQFGIYVHKCALTDFSRTRNFHHSGINLEVTCGEM